MIKDEIRIIGWDDCSHKSGQKNVLVVGVVFRGGKFIDGLLSTVVKKDGFDATEKLAERITGSRHYDQLSVIMLDGITMAGFNVVDLKELNKKTQLPVIAILRKKPDKKRFFEAICSKNRRFFGTSKNFVLRRKKLGNSKKRLEIAKRAGKIYSYEKIFYQKSGLSTRDCEKILSITCLHGNMPEPIRVAHLIASGLSGESRGRA
ncbi:MAG: DUF99 family protein [Candidatus Aenigmarchaeota archaeon]|nr:DUF99 family protein [Candidatus Aenigmarchaeota archaeon]